MFPKDLLSAGTGPDKSALLAGAVDPRGPWRSMDDRAAVAGKSLCKQARIDAWVGDYYFRLWFQSALLVIAETPPFVVSGGLPFGTRPAEVRCCKAGSSCSFQEDRGIPADVTPRIFECARRCPW